MTRSQLIAAGLSDKAIRHRVATGRLHRVHRGVYSVGYLAENGGRERAAVLALEPNAFLSDLSAAARWRFLPPHEGPVHVVVARHSARSRRDIRVHRTVLLDPRDFTTLDGIPITAPARTLLDVAAVVPTNVLERAVAEAQVLKRVNDRHLREVIARSGRHPGAAALRRALGHGPGLTRSEAERILRRLLDQADLRDYFTNHRIGRYEVDFHFHRHGVIVEVDGYAPHGHAQAFERDRRKRSALAAQGYTVLAFTYRQLTNEPHWVIAQVAAALAQSSYTTAGELARRASASMPVAGSGREK